MSSNTLPFPVTGAVLAGGRSTRMGRDKAFLSLDGVTLIARQTALLRSLGMEDLFVSGRPGIDYAVPGARLVTDAVPDAGPLAGLAALLAAASHPWVMVIAVDLPLLPAAYLHSLLSIGAGRTGVVPHGPHGYEPLVALYPRTLLPGMHAALAEKQFGLQRVIQTAIRNGLMQSITINEEHMPYFTNWNSPGDLAPSFPAPQK